MKKINKNISIDRRKYIKTIIISFLSTTPIFMIAGCSALGINTGKKKQEKRRVYRIKKNNEKKYPQKEEPERSGTTDK